MEHQHGWRRGRVLREWLGRSSLGIRVFERNLHLNKGPEIERDPYLRHQHVRHRRRVLQHCSRKGIRVRGIGWDLHPIEIPETNATAINVTGEVAGDYEKGPDDRTFGFVYSDGTYSTINIPGSLDTFVTGINASGDVTGYYVTDSKDAAGELQLTLRQIRDCFSIKSRYFTLPRLCGRTV
jgi:hypothetical protein